MTHVFSFPDAVSPLVSVPLHPAYVVIQTEHLEPVQRMIETADGTQWLFQLSGHRLQTYEVIVTELQDVDRGGFAGYLRLRAFFATTTNFAMAPFALTHTDGGTVMVRLSPGPWQLTEGRKGEYSGRFALRRVV